MLKVLSNGIYDIDTNGEDLYDYIYKNSYFDYLTKTLGVTDPGVLQMARVSCNDMQGVGADVLTIEEALYSGVLGLDVKDLKSIYGKRDYKDFLAHDGFILDESDDPIYHFPDGNATITRMLLKRMIPAVAKAETPEDMLLDDFKYAELDKSSNAVRLRLNSTVVNVRHDGDPKSASDVFVNYINDGKSYQVKGKGVVMACYNMMIPHIVSGLPDEQSAALKRNVKIPLVYTSVMLKNWGALKEMGIGHSISPGNMHQQLMLDFPVSLGGYKCTTSADEPCILQMISCPLGDKPQAPPVDQFREARYKMLGYKFEDYETEVKAHLNGMLGGAGFKSDDVISGITVNRWAHGYAHYGYHLYDSDMPKMAKKGRKQFGRITVANSDASVTAYVHAAIDEAHRAVEELG